MVKVRFTSRVGAIVQPLIWRHSMNSFQYFIGIDPAKDTFAAAIFTDLQQPRQIGEGFSNNPDGFEAFEKWLETQKVQKSSALMVIEATGVYGEALCHDLTRRGYWVCLEAPQKVKRAFKLKGHKTDPLDALQIAEYAFRFQDQLRRWQPPAEIVEHLNVCLTVREQLVAQKTATINALKALQKKVIQTPQAIELYQHNIQLLQEQITTLEGYMTQLLTENPQLRQTVQLLDSAPAIGQLTAMNLLLVTNAFTELLDYPKLAAFIGICPYKHDSGSSIHKKARSSQEGPPRLRKLLHLASRSLIVHHPSYKRYYQRKIAQGKPPMLVLNNISNKLLRLCCAIIKTQKPYEPKYVSINPSFL